MVHRREHRATRRARELGGGVSTPRGEGTHGAKSEAGSTAPPATTRALLAGIPVSEPTRATGTHALTHGVTQNTFARSCGARGRCLRGRTGANRWAGGGWRASDEKKALGKKGGKKRSGRKRKRGAPQSAGGAKTARAPHGFGRVLPGAQHALLCRRPAPPAISPEGRSYLSGLRRGRGGAARWPRRTGREA